MKPSTDDVRQSERQADIPPLRLHNNLQTGGCLICRKPLWVGQRKVHPGDCARARKTQLQKLARWRRR